MREAVRRVAATRPEVDDVVRREVVGRALTQAMQSNLMSLGLVLIVALGLRGAEVGPGLAWWSGLTVANVAVFHLGARRLVRLVADPGRPLNRSLRALIALDTLGGCVWGSLTLLALPSGEYAAQRSVVATAVIIALSGNMAFSSPAPPAFLAFHLALVGVAATGLVRNGAIALAVLLVFAAVAALPLAKGLYEHIAQASVLARQNALLAADLTEANTRLAHLATRDTLTGLANRAFFDESIGATLSPAGRATRARGDVAVVYLDLDNFKQINDTLGHAAGDDLLVQVADRVGAVLRASDVFTRRGGDEFVILLRDTSPAGARATAERVLECFSAPFGIAGRSVAVTASLGVAQDDGTGSADDLVEQADAALYRAKALGRNRAEFHL